MQTNKNYRNATILMIITALMLFINHPVLGLIFIPFVIVCIAFHDFKLKEEHDKSFYIAIVTLSLVLMFVLEYFLVPIQNVMFYIFLIVLSIGFFLVAYLSFTFKSLNQKEKIVGWTGVALIALSFPMLIGFIINFMFSLIIGVFALIIILVAFFIRKRRSGRMF
jgi:hypothetical protein